MIMMSWIIETMMMTITISYDRRVTTYFMPKCWVNWCTNHEKPFLLGFLPLCSSYNFPSILCSSPLRDFRMTLRWKRGNKTARTNEQKERDLVYWMHTKAHGFWLVRRTLEQCLLHIIGFLWPENEESMFWSFHLLADKTCNEHLPKTFFIVTRKSL